MIRQLGSSPVSRAKTAMTDESDDLEVTLKRLQEGEPQALASLFALYRDRLRRMVELRLDARLRGRVSASDILQEAYIGALERLAHYQASPSIPAFVWIRSVTLQRMIDVHRRHLGAKLRAAGREVRLGQEDQLGASSEQIAVLIADATSASHAARRGETLAQLQHALDQLEPIDRDVLVLRHFEQLTNQEAAACLGIKATAASKRYVRAIERLRDVLEQIPGFEGGAV
jgi:RNA polymerase sigma-70 factor (ECF subfamily)